MIQTETYHTEFMQEFIEEQVGDIEGCTLVNDDGNIYITKGDAELYPCIVAHTDTVHDMVDWFEIFETSDGCLFAMNVQTMEQTGIGGDDKVGVFICLEMLRTTDNIKVVFFKDEEHGCLGSQKADMRFFDDVSFVLQCDRRGYEDFVRSIFMEDMYDQSFSEAIAPLLKKYKRKECLDGGMTDVWQLADKGLEVCVANMSCGYYNPHSDEEYVDVDEVKSTLDFVKELFKTLDGKQWIIKRDVKQYTGYGRYGGYSRSYNRDVDRDWDNYDTPFEDSTFVEVDEFDRDGLPINHKDTEQCSTCGGYETMYDLHSNMNFCFSCQDYCYEKDRQ